MFNFNVLIVLLSVIVWFLPLLYRKWSKENADLFIVIPSSPDHLEQRKSLRNTWLQLLPEKFNYKFIVGDKMCNIHPLNRISAYSCESLNISLPKGVTENTLIYFNFTKTNIQKLHSGWEFMFVVHHPVIVHSLGILKDMLTPGNDQIVRVALYYMNPSDHNHAKRISSVTFHDDSLTQLSDIRYVYKKLSSPYYLPKGFEGSITVEKVSGFNEEENCPELNKKIEDINLNTVVNIITASSSEVSKNNFCILPSFGFTIKDISGLERSLNHSEEMNVQWKKYNEEVHQQLRTEIIKHNDILLLDVIDVYRNLPKKMLLFFKWLFQNFKVHYVLKTDDDTFVDLLKIQEELKKSVGWDWWSCFRISWPVQRFGKWLETSDYQEDTYPPFPTGSGYVLAERALHWLEYRLDSLSAQYQGEDVAMGLWLEDLAPSRHVGEVCYWACQEPPACHPHSCNIMQLNVSEVYKTWRQYRDCGNNLCNCASGGFG